MTTCPHCPTPASPALAVRRRVMTPQLKGMGLLLMAILLWGVNWPVMKVGLSHVTPVWFSACRFVIGAMCLFAVQLATGSLYRPRRQDMPLIASVGLLQMLAFTLLGALAMADIPAGRSAVLAYTTPLWVMPLAVLFFREQLATRQWVGTVLGIVGVAVLFNPFALDWSDARLVHANLMLVAASACWALCILHLRYSKARATAYQLAPWQMLVASVPLLALARTVEGPFTGDGSATLWQIVLFVGAAATAFCFCAVNAASMWLPATSTSLAMLGVPLVGLLSSVVWLGETLSASLVVGVLAISFGILVAIVRVQPGRHA